VGPGFQRCKKIDLITDERADSLESLLCAIERRWHKGLHVSNNIDVFDGSELEERRRRRIRAEEHLSLSERLKESVPEAADRVPCPRRRGWREVLLRSRTEERQSGEQLRNART
jgi:hypothetical protein